MVANSSKLKLIMVFLALCFSAATHAVAQLPTPWQSQDIGTGGAAGSASYSNGTFTVNGAGFIWGTSDRFHFVYRTYTGDFELVARLTFLSFSSESDPSAGLMVREDLDANARHVFVMQHSRQDPPPPPPPVYVAYAWVDSISRSWKGERTLKGNPLNGTSSGYFHKLVRYKDQITVSVSPDGANWRVVEGYTVTNLAGSVKVGMAVYGLGDFSQTATATFDQVSLKALTLPHHTSWFGNSLPGGSASIQQNVQAMHVEWDAANGRVFLSSLWDESGKEANILDPNGVFYGSLDATHERGSGYAITSNGTYVYMGQREPFVDPSDPNIVVYTIRRYNRDGSVAPFAGGEGYDGSMRFVSPQVPKTVDRHIRGLAWSPDTGRLYASDTMADTVKIYNENLAWMGDFPANPPLARPRAIAVDSGGDLWIIADVGGIPKVLHYAADGTKLTFEIWHASWRPTALAIDSNDVVWVADAGPGQNIKKFNPAGPPHGSFGTLGGILSGTKGLVAPLKLNNPVGIGVDSDGNIYVAGDGGNGQAFGATELRGFGGAELRKFSSSGVLQWEKYGLEFVNSADADPASDGHDIYTDESHYTMDYSKPTGQEWTYKAMTLDRFAYPDDPRLHTDAGGVMVRRYQGKRFLFKAFTHATYLAAYRFANETSEIAIPSGLLLKIHFLAEGPPSNQPEKPSWPTNQPQTYERWIWRDSNGDGLVDSNEYQMDGPNSDIWGWYVDDNLDIWTASTTDNPTIRRYKLDTITDADGLDEHGNPIYRSVTTCSGGNCPVDYVRPPEFVEMPEDPNVFTAVMHAHYVPATDTMYLAGYTPENPLSPPDPNIWGSLGEFGMIGREILRYNNWSTRSPSAPADWRRVLPFDPSDASKAGKAMDVVGNRVYVAMPDTRKIHILDTATGVIQKTLAPGPEVAGEQGWYDTMVAFNAFQRGNGDYLVLAEEAFAAKGILYREPPTPLYQNSFGSPPNPFSSGGGTGGTTQLVTVGGSLGVEFKDTTGGSDKNAASLFTLRLNPGNALVDRINQLYGQSVGSSSVSFDLQFKLERRAASNRPASAGITGGIQFNNYDNVNVPQFPTGSPEPSLFTTLAYSSEHDEVAGSEQLEMVDRFAIVTYRFTVVPNGGVRLITSLDFRFKVQVTDGTPATTPEAYAIDDLAVSEVRP